LELAMASEIISDKDFDTQVINNKLPVLVDFWAEWCGPCKMAGPILEELSESYKDKVLVAKLNVDENPAMSQKFGVMSIPTTILFKGGKELGRQVGFSGKEAFEDLMKKGVSS
jgi:thioredoxin 1